MLPVNVVALPITTRPASSAAMAAGSPLARTGMSNRRPMRDRPGGMYTRKVRATSRAIPQSVNAGLQLGLGLLMGVLGLKLMLNRDRNRLS